MTLSRPIVVLDEWLDRAFSLGLVLAIAAALTLAKAATTVIDLDRGLPGGWSISAGLSSPAPVSSETPIIDEEKFVPWPSVLPEPAAGPEGGGDPMVSRDAEGQLQLDLSNLTEGESLALQQLLVRRRALDEREQLLEMRAELNGRTAARLDEQIEMLTQLKDQLEALTKGLDETEERKLARLVKIYETMKPKAAAAIFNQLDVKILIHVIERMKEAKSAAVLGKMDPVIAKRVTTELAKKKERPTLTDSTFGGEA